MALNAKQSAFLEHYLVGETKGDAKNSAIKAGYSPATAHNTGSGLLKNAAANEGARYMDQNNQPVQLQVHVVEAKAVTESEYRTLEAKAVTIATGFKYIDMQ